MTRTIRHFPEHLNSTWRECISIRINSLSPRRAHWPMDPLTNSMSLKEANASWFSNVQRKHGTALRLVSFDIDSFALFVDRYGFPDSDQKLIEVANKLQQYFPEFDVVRSGGDEFFVLTNQESATSDGLAKLLDDLKERKTGSISTKIITTDLFVWLYRWATKKPTHVTKTWECCFSVSCCCARVEATASIDEILNIHDRNIENIALHRYEDFQRSIQEVTGLRGVVVNGW